MTSDINRMAGRLGDHGRPVSAIGIGCNAFGVRVDADGVHQIVDAAFDHGVTLFDTADVYGFGASESLLGQALAGRRERVVVATKFGLDMQGRNGEDHGRRGTRDYVRRALEASLTRLGTDWIDLYQLHAPDRGTPVTETLDALAELVEEGLVRSIGCSNFQAWELVEAHWQARSHHWPGFVTVQNEYSLYNPSAEVELVPACLEYGIGILPYFPLAYGLLTGKYREGEEPAEGTRLAGQRHRFDSADWSRIAAIEAFARGRNLTMLEVALGGLSSRPGVSSVIAGVSHADQVAANVGAINWIPDPQDREALDALCAPQFHATTFAPAWRWQADE